MIVWGGKNGDIHLNDGGRYNPASNTWNNVSATSAPEPRYSHNAVWTGAEMIIWAGVTNSGPPDYIEDVYNNGGPFHAQAVPRSACGGEDRAGLGLLECTLQAGNCFGAVYIL